MDGDAGQEVERLWRAFRRDLGPALLEAAGLTDEVRALPRLERTWAKLCEASPSMAASLYHAIDQVHSMVSRSPAAEHHVAQLDEVLDQARLSRALDPGVPAATVGDLLEAGESAIAQGLEDLDEYRRHRTD